MTKYENIKQKSLVYGKIVNSYKTNSDLTQLFNSKNNREKNWQYQNMYAKMNNMQYMMNIFENNEYLCKCS